MFAVRRHGTARFLPSLASKSSNPLLITKRTVYEYDEPYEGMIRRNHSSDPRLNPAPDSHIDGIFRWPASPEFNAPLHEEADLVWFDGVADIPCLDLEKPSPYISVWTMYKHFFYYFGGAAAVYWALGEFGRSRSSKIRATPPEFPYGNYIEHGGKGSYFEYSQFSPAYPEDYKQWFLEQIAHPDNSDFKDGILAPYKMSADGVMTRITGFSSDHAHDDHGEHH